MGTWARSRRASGLLITLVLVASCICSVICADEDPLQDFCVFLKQSTTTINGLVCKNAADVIPADFKSGFLSLAGNTNNKLGLNVTLANALKFPGLNTQGLSIARIDFAQYGLNPPHAHPRASEVIFVVSGKFYVGFVDTNNTLFAQYVQAGDLFVFPRGLVHFQLNVGKGTGLLLASFNSQNPGVSRVAKALFKVEPKISDEVLEITFQIDGVEVEKLRQSVGTT